MFCRRKSLFWNKKKKFAGANSFLVFVSEKVRGQRQRECEKKTKNGGYLSVRRSTINVEFRLFFLVICLFISIESRWFVFAWRFYPREKCCGTRRIESTVDYPRRRPEKSCRCLLFPYSRFWSIAHCHQRKSNRFRMTKIVPTNSISLDLKLNWNWLKNEKKKRKSSETSRRWKWIRRRKKKKENVSLFFSSHRCATRKSVEKLNTFLFFVSLLKKRRKKETFSFLFLLELASSFWLNKKSEQNSKRVVFNFASWKTEEKQNNSSETIPRTKP